MTDDQKTKPHATEHKEVATKHGRRGFLLMLPVGIFAGMFATVAAAAYRFLRPASAETSAAAWTNIAPLAQIKGDKPVMRSIVVERKEGWATTAEEHFVYVLPHKQNQVLSSACPHEGCNVSWQDETNQFACPCHDSFFGPDGSVLSGPARRGLDPLPAREQNGVLQAQFQTFENNTAERIVRG